MTSWLREGSGLVLLGGSLAVLAYGVGQLRARDYIACIILVLTGLSMLKAAVALLRPSAHD
jgi:hypothetical protein